MLLVSPSLAQTLGLEEALLLQLVQELKVLSSNDWVTLTDQQRAHLLPFWSKVQFNSVLKRLEAQGVIELQGQNPWTIAERFSGTADSQPATEAPIAKPQMSAPPPAPAEPTPVYAMNEARRRNQSDDDLAYLRETAKPKKPVSARKTAMSIDWEPSEDFPGLLSFHNIPLPFALSEMAKFRQYYLATDRIEISWDVRFLNWVQRAWHDSLNSKGRHERQQTNHGEPADSARGTRSKVRDALRNIQDTDW